jgi:threonine synthase
VRYVSTRGGVAATTIGPALAAGLARDGGLFVPETLPRIRIDALSGRESLAAIATTLLAPFFRSDPLAAALSDIANESLDMETPLRRVAPDAWMLELFHGPTAAFKDFGARFLAACLARIERTRAKPLTVLVATSGDTGAAVAAAFHRRAGFRVVILYPHGRVSPRQAHQLGAFGDNVTTFAVDGAFDDCQSLIKHALADEMLQGEMPLTSANSISLGRLLPQAIPFAKASLEHWLAHGRRLNVIVPTGNLGNALAAVIARAMGLPVGDIVLATNANRTLADFFGGGDYAPRASVTTIANAMDVGAPSNFERLRALYADDASLRRALRADSVDDDAIRAEIAASPTRYGAAICPHTATAAVVLERLRARGDTRDFAIVATAHPAKFDAIVEPLIGARVAVPPSLATILAQTSRAEPLEADYATFRARLAGLR